MRETGVGVKRGAVIAGAFDDGDGAVPGETLERGPDVFPRAADGVGYLLGREVGRALSEDLDDSLVGARRRPHRAGDLDVGEAG